MSHVKQTIQDCDWPKVGSYEQEFDHAWKLSNLRFEYAWRYFELHAKQRMTMFNYFIIFTGFLVSACVQLFIKEHYVILVMASIFGIAITLLFIGLDRRNQELVTVADDVLLVLENDFIFKGVDSESVKPAFIDRCGKHRTEKHRAEKHRAEKPESMKLGIFRRQKFEDCYYSKSIYAHGRLMPLVQWCICIVYLALACYAVYLIASPSSVSSALHYPGNVIVNF